MLSLEGAVRTHQHRLLAESDANIEAAAKLLRVNAGINALASLVTLLLMTFMWRNGTLKVNLFIKCVMLMTFSQLLYDLAIPFRLSAQWIEYAGIIFGGMGASMWSLMILVTAIYTVRMRKSPTRRQQLLAFIMVTSLVTAYTIAYKICDDKNVSLRYSQVRLAMIAFDFAAFAWIFCIYQKRGVGKDKTQNPLYHVLRRLGFYPLIQVACRLGAEALNTAHGYSEIFNEPSNGAFLDYLGALLVPSAGLGAFFVFLFAQNGARTQLWRMCKCDFSGGGGSGSGSQTPASTMRAGLSHQEGAGADFDEDGDGAAAAAQAPSPSHSRQGAEAEKAKKEAKDRDGEHDQDYENGNAHVNINVNTMRLSIMDEQDLMNEYIHEVEEEEAEAAAGRLTLGRSTFGTNGRASVQSEL